MGRYWERLAGQTGMQLLYADDEAAGKMASRVSGRYTPGQALQQLLAGSGLTFRFIDAHTVAIQKKQDADKPEIRRTQSPDTGPINLEPMVVTATKTERLASEVPGLWP